LEDEYFNLKDNLSYLKNYFKTETIKGLGISDESYFINAIASLLKYAEDTQKKTLNHITKIEKKNFSDYMQLDESTIANLELLYPIQTSGDLKATVFAVINKTLTAMGQRMLRYWLVNPLINAERLQARLDSVEYFHNNPIITDDTAEFLNKIYDFERLSGKIGLESANPKDIVLLKESLITSLELFKSLSSENLPERLKFLTHIENKDKIDDFIAIVENTLKEDPPAETANGGYVKDGFNSEVDDLRNTKFNSTKILKEIQKRESSATGITSLKIGFNKVFGYYIEITRTNADKVPDSYIRKQTLANAERYITQELKELEDKILSADDKLIALENQIYLKLISELKQYIPFIQQIAQNIAEIDCFASFAQTARLQRFIKPEITRDNILEIKDGRHIVVEQLQDNFITNNASFNTKNGIFHILTGPNMSGKSTYIRQVALITLLAQIGSFVPALKMKFSLVDRIFTRVGASDNLAKGESTFMLEMIETSNIINNATNRSLIILDEVGRGTSTYDGVAIAWAIIEYIIDNIGAKTLFATHYHELIELDKRYKSIKNYHVSVAEANGEVIFQYKIESGGTDRSYGVHVAKIAGVPEEIVKRANEILGNFENSDKVNTKKEKKLKKIQPKKIHPEQIGLL
ncbi:DNA mismatch repair protein MutS, partial [Candidatus Dojkabacteria bacterium]|nr:DNA mismatch repair protein MutS [Candidatus Dojkabacteria bacterium]